VFRIDVRSCPLPPVDKVYFKWSVRTRYKMTRPSPRLLLTLTLCAAAALSGAIGRRINGDGAPSRLAGAYIIQAPPSNEAPSKITTVSNAHVSLGPTSQVPIPLLADIDSLEIPLPKLPQVNPTGHTEIIKSYGKLPLSFESNSGQADARVRFLARGAGYTVFLTSTKVVLRLKQGRKYLSKPARGDRKGRVRRLLHRNADLAPTAMNAALQIELLRANPNVTVTGVDELPGKSNYFVGNDPKNWRTNVRTFAKVRYRDIYPGVDLAFYGSGQELETDFVLSPSTNSRAIRLRISGASKLRVNDDGDLEVALHDGRFLVKKPLAYQLFEGERRIVSARYALVGHNEVSFVVESYDRTRALVVDPILSYSTYLGGQGDDQAATIAVDSTGNAYVAGVTGSSTFPTTPGVVQGNFKGTLSCSGYVPACGDAFIAKLNATGTALIYSTYLGGTDNDWITAIAVDSSGNAYVTGHTGSADFPTTPGAFRRVCAMCAPPGNNSLNAGDVFVTKLSAAGDSLLYSTYVGEGNADFHLDPCGGIAVDSSGSAYITGCTGAQFPVTPGAFQTVYPSPGYFAAFATKLDPTGSGLVYSTYLGGKSPGTGRGIAVDASGNAYVTGFTTSSDFPTTAGAFQTTPGGSYDAFVTKLNSTGSTLVYSTFLGGSDVELGNSIALDGSGSAYVTGSTYSANFPTTTGAFQTTLGGSCSPPSPCGDAFVSKLNPAGSSLVYSTFLGGSNDDEGSGIGVDSKGNAFVTGYTKSTDFPLTNPLQPTKKGFANAFATELNATGSFLIFSTYLGGTGIENFTGVDQRSGAIAVDPSGNAYITGFTSSVDFPTTAGAIQIAYGGAPNDAFVVKISPGAALAPTISSVLPTSGTQGQTIANFTVNGNNFDPAATLSFGGTGITVNSYSSRTSTQIVASIGISTTAPLGPQDVIVTNPDLQHTQLSNAFTVISAPVPIVSLSTSSLIFPNQAVGTTSGAMSINVTNSGNATLNITAAPTITGTNASDFALANGTTCVNGAAVAAGSSCALNVIFSPTAAGNRGPATLSIFDNASNSPQVVSLSGIGIVSIGTPAVTLSAASVSFGNQAVSTISAAQNVMLTNSGTGSLNILSILITGVNAGDFLISNTSTCPPNGGMLAPSASCLVSIAFKPTAQGLRNAGVAISDNAASSPQSISLFGTALPMPVLFIPGIMGSYLVDKSTNTELWPGCILTAHNPSLSLFPQDNPSASIVATDVIRQFTCLTYSKDVYSNLITSLVSQAGYHEYQVGGNIGRLTTNGCDMSQQSSLPTLFVFPYDWRKDNSQSADALRDYVGCIHQFYPGAKINVIAHSMGGLVARRYIITNPGTHSVNALITVGTPWLGAPKAIDVLETGDYQPFTPVLIFDPTLKHIANSFPGAHELLPSKSYFDLGGTPLAESGRDFDNDSPDGTDFEVFNYSTYLAALNLNYGACSQQLVCPGSTTDTFHTFGSSVGSQDDWRIDSTGVNSYIVYGIQNTLQTEAQVSMTYSVTCSSATCISLPSSSLVFTAGDGTVPSLSALRQANGLDYNSPAAVACRVSPPPSGDDNLAEHVGMLSNNDVLGLLQQILIKADGTIPPAKGTVSCEGAGAAAHTVATNQTAATQHPNTRQASASSPTTSEPLWYIIVNGGDSFVVADSNGNSTALVAGSLYGSVPGVTTGILGDKINLAMIPTIGNFTVTFKTTPRPLAIDLVEANDVSVMQAVRYRDVVLAAGLNAQIKLSSAGPDVLRYDSTGSGNFGIAVQPNVSVNGTAAQDRTPPTLSFSASFSGGATLVTISAVDTESGVKDVLYSLDGTHFQPYTNTLSLNATAGPIVYAFADDNVGNRSSLSRFLLPLPTVTLSSNSLIFASQVVGTGSNVQTVTLSNLGSAPLIIIGFTVAGANSGDFAVANGGTCPASGGTVTAGANCTINLTFAPVAAGSRFASLTITDNASGSPQSVSLTGTATDFSVGPAGNGSTSASITAGQTATYSLQVNPSNGFTGQVVLSCTGAPSHASCFSNPHSVSLNGSAVAFSVTVTTSANAELHPHEPPQLPLAVNNSYQLFSLMLIMCFFLRVVLHERPKWRPLALTFLASVLFLTLTGCGGGGTSSPPPAGAGTPPGLYTLTLSGASAGATRNLTLSLTVK
jgi:pimeloyl-ACP methyl ester carboxylesterase